MNLKHLETFVMVAELQSFTATARKLYMSQPAVSFQIKSLEEDLGVTLFQRGEKKLTLTPAGRLMYPEAKKMVLRYQKIKAGIEDLQGLKTGHLMVGASTTPGEYLMPLLIGGFCKQYPGINVTLRVAGSEQVLRWLKEREIDIGITGVITSGNWVSCEPWIADELFLIACPGHPWTVKGTAGPGELTREPFILREAGSGTRRSFEQKLIEIGLEPGKINTVMELGSTRAVITAVQAGLGVGVVSGWAARDSLELGSVSRITLPFDMRRHLYLVWAKNNLDGPLAGEFQKFIGDPGNYGPFV